MAGLTPSIPAAMGRRACGFVIFRRFAGPVEYLLLQASYKNHHWTPPKGHVDKGESDMETALRETEEEAGILGADLKIFEDAKRELTYPVKGEPKTAVYWLAELVNKEREVRLSNEHQAFAWLGLEEACQRARHEGMQGALRDFDKYISEEIK